MSNLQSNELSERELDILKLVATGASNKEIAQKLFISSNTVKVHLRNIFTKISATSRTEAAMYAVRIGLVENAISQVQGQDEGLLSGYETGQVPNQTSNIPIDNNRPNTSARRRIERYIGISLSIIIVIIFGFYIARNNVGFGSAPIAPTTTPRVQWFEMKGLPTPRQGLAAVSYENSIYAIGGSDVDGISGKVEKYDTQANQWTSLASKPTPVTDINAAVIGGLIYVPGGKLSSGLPTNTTEIYDPELNKWSTGKPLPEALSDYSLAVFEGKIYIFGGWDGKQVMNSVYIFDPHDEIWTEGSPMPTSRSSAGTTAIGGKIYIIGGWDGSQALTVCEIFRPDLIDEKREWTTAPSLPYGRYGMSVSNLADMVLIIGGTNRIEDPAVIVLLPGSNEWSKLDSPIQYEWSKLTSVVVGSRLYAFGGISQNSFTDQMWSYQAIYTITLPIIR